MTEAVGKSLHLLCSLEAGDGIWGGVESEGLVWAFETSRPIPSATPLYTRPHLVPPNTLHQLDTK